jgi:hypothetical protein
MEECLNQEGFNRYVRECVVGLDKPLKARYIEVNGDIMRNIYCSRFCIHGRVVEGIRKRLENIFYNSHKERKETLTK